MGLARRREPTTARPLVAEGAGRGCKRPSIVDALSPAARLPGRPPGGLPARARNHLLHAHLESWQGAILVLS